MKRLLLLLACCLAPYFSLAQEDTLHFARLDSALVGYMAGIERLETDAKADECDFLIGSAADSVVRRHIALFLYDAYKDSRLMGDEAVAIYLYDTYFASGKIPMRSEFDRMEADIFATFNRATLLGRKAPRVSLLNPCGRKVEIPEAGSLAILYFYDTGCGKCRVQSAFLPGVLQDVGFPVRFYAVYCGTDKAAWRKFRRTFRVRNPRVGVVHLWDPRLESDYLKAYGVISTPRLYVALEDGEIVGRRLEVESLQEILAAIRQARL